MAEYQLESHGDSKGDRLKQVILALPQDFSQLLSHSCRRRCYIAAVKYEAFVSI